MKKRGRTVRGAAALLVCASLVAGLAGCGSSYTEVHDFSESQLVGTWVVPNAQASIDVGDDGTFVAENWPTDLGCDDVAPSRSADIDWGDVSNFSGRAVVYPRSMAGFISETETCDGSVKLYFFLGLGEGSQRDRPMGVMYLPRSGEDYPMDDESVTVRLVKDERS